MIDWAERIGAWVREVLGVATPPAKPTFILGQVAKPNAPRPMFAAILIPKPDAIKGAARCRVTFHKDWNLATRYGTWTQVRALWARFGDSNPWERPIVYGQPSGGFSSIAGQPVRIRNVIDGGDGVSVRLRDRDASVPASKMMYTVSGYERRSCRIAWRDRDSWLHWKSRIYFSTADMADFLPAAVTGRDRSIRATLHFGVHKRLIQNTAGKKAEELAAKIGQLYYWTAAIIGVFGDADPVMWKASRLEDWDEFKALSLS